MGMPAHETVWTAEMVRALPDDRKRHEVLDGELVVSPAPTWPHQRMVRELIMRIHPYCEAHGMGETLLSPSDIEFSPRDLVQPDVFVVPNKAATWEEARTLLLAVEVLSPSTARIDRGPKRVTYQRFEIPEYWIVDLDARVVERWRPGDDRPEILVDALTWHRRESAPGLTIDLQKLFSIVLD